MNRLEIERNTDFISSMFSDMGEQLDIKKYKKGQVLSFFDDSGKQVCYWLHCGCVSILRNSDHVRAFPVSEEMCFGIFGGPSFLKRYALIIDLESTISCLEVSKVRKLLLEKNLIENVVSMQVKIIDDYTEYFDEVSIRDTYKEVCFLLNIMIKLPESMRNQIKLTHFIEQRTSMSRSNMMNILSQLKLRKCIIVNEGFLKHIIHLPDYKFW